MRLILVVSSPPTYFSLGLIMNSTMSQLTLTPFFTKRLTTGVMTDLSSLTILVMSRVHPKPYLRLIETQECQNYSLCIEWPIRQPTQSDNGGTQVGWCNFMTTH